MNSLFTRNASPSDDGVTNLRNERKYELNQADIGKVHTILQVNNKQVIHAGPVSQVNSIYFDDDFLSSAKENLAGIGLRTKLRLRWYDSELPGNHFFFEMKRRIHHTITKERFSFTSRVPLREMSYRKILDELFASLPSTISELLHLRQQPVVLVRYKRQHYVSRDVQTNIRVTLDHDIECFEQLGLESPALIFKSPLHGRVVLEVKSLAGSEHLIRRQIHPLQPRQTRFSKYVLSCQLLGYSSGISQAFV